jgi:hypothetical protein
LQVEKEGKELIGVGEGEEVSVGVSVNVSDG